MQTELNTIMIAIPQLIINSMQLQSKLQWGFSENMINLTSKFTRTVKDHGSPRLVLPKLFHITVHVENDHICTHTTGASFQLKAISPETDNPMSPSAFPEADGIIRLPGRRRLCWGHIPEKRLPVKRKSRGHDMKGFIYKAAVLKTPGSV